MRKGMHDQPLWMRAGSDLVRLLLLCWFHAQSAAQGSVHLLLLRSTVHPIAIS